MNKLENILVPIDLTDSAPLLIQQAVRLATWNNASLHLLHVIDRTTLRHFEATHGKQNHERLIEEAQQILDAQRGNLIPDSLNVTETIAQGHPATCILQQIDVTAADLVLLSAHDNRKKRLGRVASDVVRHARCKVLISRDWQAAPFQNIAVCLDYSELSGECLRQAIEMAAQENAALELIHVQYPVDRDFYIYKLNFGKEDPAHYRERMRKEFERAHQEYLKPFEEDLSKVSHRTTRLESTDPAVAITAHLQAHHTDLVVLGTTGHESVFGLRFGSNAERLIHDTPCSVLAIKPS